MDFHRLTTRYKQFGGIRLVWEYARMGVLPTIFVAFFRCLVKGKSFKAIYLEVLKRIEPKLIAKYGSRVQEFKGLRVQEFKKFKGSRSLSIEHKHPKVIWWCWLQGKEQAPSVVQACYNSLRRNLPEYEIKVIDGKNWREYVELPDYIVRKWKKGRIPAALFSDLLRLQLLIRYGGTWIDSTVLCTGFESLSGSKSLSGSRGEEYLEADLFLFQYTSPECEWSGNISNWFISAHSNNEVLMVLRDMLFVYWKDYDCTLDYYMFHLFFKLVAKEYPEQIAAMPYGYSMNSLVLLHHWSEKFDQKKWDKLMENVCFHKLAFRIGDEVKSNITNYYNHILEAYGGV